jgi:hypothetical protein
LVDHLMTLAAFAPEFNGERGVGEAGRGDDLAVVGDRYFTV